MKFLSTSRMIDYKIVELPKTCYKVMPPRKWQVALTVASIVVVSLLWSIS